MDRITEIESLLENSRQAMLSSNFADGSRSCERAIKLLHELEATPSTDVPMEAIRQNLANAYCDLASCLLEMCGPKVNPAVHALLSAIKYGNTESGVLENVLFCISQVNAFMEAASSSAPDCLCRDDLVRWHNRGHELLKTSYPPGTPGRDWQGAVAGFEEAIKVAPDCAASYHGLGLACEGAQREMDAIKAWLKVKFLKTDYNFQTRLIFE